MPNTKDKNRQEYAIIDIETTGGYAGNHKITEIAIYIHDGKKIVDEFVTLINPERAIPYHIETLTGITNEMVADAPKFYEVAKEIFLLTENRVFVAHNVGFDYSFVRQEYTSLGGNYIRKKLCTVRLSRKIFPGYPSYSLGKLCQHLGIPLENRHRAAGDALATVKLFELLLREDQQELIGKALQPKYREATLPPHLPRQSFEQLPEATGIYYFHNKNGKIIYIGKAKDLKQRVYSHFTANNIKDRAMREETHDITYELTGNELVALLLESEEIKKYWPRFNSAQKRTADNYGIFQYLDNKGYLRLGIDRTKQLQEALITFPHILDARRFLFNLAEEYRLCPKLCSLQQSPTSCFDFRIKKCDGACCGKVNSNSYNQRVEESVASFDRVRNSFLIVEKGRAPLEQAIVMIEDGAYLGYGFVDKNETIASFEQARDFIQHHHDNRDIQRILGKYLRKQESAKIITKQELVNG